MIAYYGLRKRANHPNEPTAKPLGESRDINGISKQKVSRATCKEDKSLSFRERIVFKYLSI